MGRRDTQGKLDHFEKLVSNSSPIGKTLVSKITVYIEDACEKASPTL